MRQIWPQPFQGWQPMPTPTQGSSQARNPGLEDTIPLGLNECGRCILGPRPCRQLWTLDFGLWTHRSLAPEGSEEDLKLGSHMRMLSVSAGWEEPRLLRMMSAWTRPLEPNS